MKKGKALFIFLVLALGVFMYFWEPWNARWLNSEPENAVEILMESRKAVGDIENYTYKSHISVGNQVNVDILDRIDREKDQQIVDFTWEIPQLSGETSMYVQGEEVYVLSPLKKKWVKPEEDPSAGPFVKYFYRQLNLVDPVSNVLRTDTQNENVSLRSKSGQEYVIEVIPDAGALSELTDSMPPQLKGAELKEIKQVFRISRQSYLPVNYQVYARVSLFGLASMQLEVVSEPEEYDNTELNIPKELEQKLKSK
ncbi:hypothetical protein [Phosphitispora sp. TUW77]|uniref:hypothetical protein n=1 Tax=Phosphitispora sp. TUW77 TaxID=3152361 RepID=UPI003AB3BA64